MPRRQEHRSLTVRSQDTELLITAVSSSPRGPLPGGTRRAQPGLPLPPRAETGAPLPPQPCPAQDEPQISAGSSMLSPWGWPFPTGHRAFFPGGALGTTHPGEESCPLWGPT